MKRKTHFSNIYESSLKESYEFLVGRFTYIEMDERIVWIDLETTGLNVENCVILEIACIVTDKDLNIIDSTQNITINRSDDILFSMGEWCTEQHSKSGLIQRSRESNITIESAELIVLDMIMKHTVKGLCPLAGNSVGFDKMFLSKEMPKIVDHLNYRIIDVSSISELRKRWRPSLDKPLKQGKHRALDDINESIKELLFYKSNFFSL